MKYFNSVLILAAVTACSSPREEPAHSFRIYEEDGVTIAETKGKSRYQEDPFIFQHQCQILQEETNHASLITRVGNCFIGPGGLIFIGDTGSPRVLVFNTDGSFLREIGQRGAGPGEFRAVRLHGIIRGNVAVSDNRLRRTSLFNIDGSFIRSFVFPHGKSEPPLSFNAFLAFPGPGNLVISYEQAFVRFESSTGAAVRVGVYSEHGEMIAEVTKPAIPFPEPFQGTPNILYQPAFGIYLALGTEGIIEKYGLDGELTYVMRLDIPKEPVTAEERQKAIQHEQDMIENTISEEIRRAREERLESITFPHEKDFWFEIAVDEFGYIWASKPPGSYDTPPWDRSYRVITPEGEYLGDTCPPEQPGISGNIYFSQGFLICSYIAQDSGAPVVEIFRILPAVEGLRYP